MLKINKIGITGSSGILGKSLIHKLKKKKYIIVSYKDNILDKNKLNKWIDKYQFDVVLHLAAVVPTEIVKNNYIKSKNVNFKGTKNLVQSIKKYQKKKTYLFFSSSSHVYFFSNKVLTEKSPCKGISKYGKTKILAENYLIKNSKNYELCIGRISSLTSEKQSKIFFLVNLINKISKKKYLLFGNSNIKRNFIHVEDVSNLITSLIKKKITGIYNISSSETTNFNYLFDFLKKIYGANIEHVRKKNNFLVLSNKLLLKKIGNYKFIKLEEIIKRIIKKKSKKLT